MQCSGLLFLQVVRRPTDIEFLLTIILLLTKLTPYSPCFYGVNVLYHYHTG